MNDEINNKLKKIIDEQEKLLKSVNDVLPILQQTERNLKRINDMTGATKRANDIREEIETKGWEIVSRIRNPEICKNNDPAAEPLWEFYKYIYEDMKRKGEIKE